MANHVVGRAAWVEQAGRQLWTAVHAGEQCSTLGTVDLIVAEIRMVEYVEEIHAELHSDAFRQLEVLIHRQVGIQETRTATVPARLGVRRDGADLIADKREGVRI